MMQPSLNSQQCEQALVPAIVVPFICEAHCDAVCIKGPELLVQPIFQLALPFPRQEPDDFFPADNEFSAIAPAASYRVSQRNFLWISRVPSIFCHADFLLS